MFTFYSDCVFPFAACTVVVDAQAGFNEIIWIILSVLVSCYILGLHGLFSWEWIYPEITHWSVDLITL
jgi:hypothetical protein